MHIDIFQHICVWCKIELKPTLQKSGICNSLLGPKQRLKKLKKRNRRTLWNLKQIASLSVWSFTKHAKSTIKWNLLNPAEGSTTN